MYYNNKNKLIPDNLIKAQYLGQNASLYVMDYFKDGEEAIKIHKYFLDNINIFRNNNLSPYNITGERSSICMFGKESYSKEYSYGFIWNGWYKPKKFQFDDETHTFPQS